MRRHLNKVRAKAFAEAVDISAHTSSVIASDLGSILTTVHKDLTSLGFEVAIIREPKHREEKES